MARKLRVYGWQDWRPNAKVDGPKPTHPQTREVVAAYSKTEVERLAEPHRGRLSNLDETGNEAEIERAMSEPGVIFWCWLSESYLREKTWHRDNPLDRSVVLSPRSVADDVKAEIEHDLVPKLAADRPILQDRLTDRGQLTKDGAAAELANMTPRERWGDLSAEEDAALERWENDRLDDDVAKFGPPRERRVPNFVGQLQPGTGMMLQPGEPIGTSEAKPEPVGVDPYTIRAGESFTITHTHTSDTPPQLGHTETSSAGGYPRAVTEAQDELFARRLEHIAAGVPVPVGPTGRLVAAYPAAPLDPNEPSARCGWSLAGGGYTDGPLCPESAVVLVAGLDDNSTPIVDVACAEHIFDMIEAAVAINPAHPVQVCALVIEDDGVSWQIARQQWAATKTTPWEVSTQ